MVCSKYSTWFAPFLLGGTLSDENKSLMTVIRLLNNQAATKEDGKCFSRNADNGSSGNLHINQ